MFDALLLTCFTHAQVADFGLSLSLNCDKSHVSGIRHGTPLYVAPEVLTESKVSKAADLYAFGVILWELYHGTLAWQHLMDVSSSVPRKGRYAAFYRGLFSYDDGGPMPAYVALGRACLSEDPLARPTFEEVQEAISAMQATLQASSPSNLQPEVRVMTVPSPILNQGIHVFCFCLIPQGNTGSRIRAG